MIPDQKNNDIVLLEKKRKEKMMYSFGLEQIELWKVEDAQRIKTIESIFKRKKQIPARKLFEEIYKKNLELYNK